MKFTRFTHYTIKFGRFMMEENCFCICFLLIITELQLHMGIRFNKFSFFRWYHVLNSQFSYFCSLGCYSYGAYLLFQNEKTYLNKLNVILVQVIATLIQFVLRS